MIVLGIGGGGRGRHSLGRGGGAKAPWAPPTPAAYGRGQRQSDALADRYIIGTESPMHLNERDSLKIIYPRALNSPVSYDIKV